MARGDPLLHVRVSEELKERLEKAAKEAGRSMNAEIIQRLESTTQNEIPLVEFLRDESEELEWALAGARREQEALGKQLRELRERIIDRGATDGQALGELIIEHRWAAERVNDYERRLRKLKKILF